MYTNMKFLATFMGAEVNNEFREEVRMFSSPHIETGRFAYDLIAGEMLFIPSNHVHNFIFNNLFDVRKLFVHSRELENALARIPHYRRNFRTVRNNYKVCTIKPEYNPEDVPSTLDKKFYKFIKWGVPHDCYDISNNVTDHKSALIVSVPEVNSTVMVNPKYFDVRTCSN